MALPKKGTRIITIEGIKYRYHGHITHHEGDDYGDLIIEKAEEPRQKIKAHFTWTKLYNEYKKVGHALSHVADQMPPYVVRQTILYALKKDWMPDKGGGIVDLGNLDEKLDFSQLKVESQNPERLNKA